ncbi:MAG: hypothetical protein ACI841_004630 [Planctomycetota bacterium]|jgi:hypothetical protein
MDSLLAISACVVLFLSRALGKSDNPAQMNHVPLAIQNNSPSRDGVALLAEHFQQRSTGVSPVMSINAIAD